MFEPSSARALVHFTYRANEGTEMQNSLATLLTDLLPAPLLRPSQKWCLHSLIFGPRSEAGHLAIGITQECKHKVHTGYTT